MTRLARVVAVGVPHHVTQRGNARQFILNTDADRKVYLDLLRQSIELHSLALEFQGVSGVSGRSSGRSLGRS